MTSKTLFSFILAVAFVTVSCKNELEPQESMTESDAIVVANDNVASPDALNVNTDMQSPPVQMSQPVQPQPQQPTSQKVAPGMNPAHGQPGHRCEIPVGAPLNSAPAAGTKPAPTLSSGPIQNNPAVATPSILNPASSSTVKAGMNPEHGQPGHRCDIAVGQPLP